MPGDNVVRPVFGARKVDAPERDASVSEPLSSASETPDLDQDVHYFLSNLELVWKAHLQGDEMTNYLFDDVGYNKTDTSLELRRPVVRGYTFEQFCERLLNSSRKEWRAQPAFFGALFIEFHDRQNAMLMALEDKQKEISALAADKAKIILQIAMRAEM